MGCPGALSSYKATLVSHSTSYHNSQLQCPLNLEPTPSPTKLPISLLVAPVLKMAAFLRSLSSTIPKAFEVITSRRVTLIHLGDMSVVFMMYVFVSVEDHPSRDTREVPARNPGSTCYRAETPHLCRPEWRDTRKLDCPCSSPSGK